MGCDGGTIPKRKEIVKNKTRRPRQERNNGLSAAERWQNCALSEWILRAPIVAGHYGHLFAKENILEYLLEVRKDSLQSYHMREDHPEVLDTIHNLKDVKELKLMENPDLGLDESSSSQEEQGKWVCPVTGLATNGKFKFFFSWNCGCVVSERAIKEVPNNDKCLVCQTPYDEWDLVQINPEGRKEMDSNQAKFMARYMQKKGWLKGQNASASSQETASSEDQDNPRPSTSRSTASPRVHSRNDKRPRDDHSQDRAGPSSATSSHRSKQRPS